MSKSKVKIDCNKLINYVKIDLIRKQPFFGHLIASLPTVFTTEVPTFGVGKERSNELLIKLYVNPDYVQELFDGHDEDDVLLHLSAVMCHEMYHIIFHHLSTKFGDTRREDIAKELSVNSYVNRNHLIAEVKGQPAGVFPEDFGLPSRKSTGFYYDALKDNEAYKNMPKKQVIFCDGDCKNCPAFESDESSDDSSCTNEGDSNDCDGKPSCPKGKCTAKSLDSHELWDAVSNDPEAGEMIKDLIRQAADTCRKNDNWGNLPSEIREEIDKSFVFTKPAIPWQVILRQFIASSSESSLDYTMQRPSKRFGTRPGTKKEDRLNLAVGIDTSGSVDNAMINLFFNELYWVSRYEADITVFEIDTEIKREYPFREWDGSVTGRGGTHLEPLLKEVSDRRFDALIFFSDMGTDKFKERYRIPTMWVVNNSYYNCVADMPTQDGLFLKLSDSGDSFEVMK